MPFRDAVVAGVTLIRDAIQSSNFGLNNATQTVDGWRIAKDGTAFFQDIGFGNISIGKVTTSRLAMYRIWSVSGQKVLSALFTQTNAQVQTIPDLVHNAAFMDAAYDKGVIPGQTTNYDVTVQINVHLDAMCVVTGNTLIVELLYQRFGQDGSVQVHPEQIIWNPTVTARQPLDKTWFITMDALPGFATQLTTSLRVTTTGTGTYRINGQHSTMNTQVIHAYRVG